MFVREKNDDDDEKIKKIENDTIVFDNKSQLCFPFCSSWFCLVAVSIAVAHYKALGRFITRILQVSTVIIILLLQVLFLKSSS